MMKKKCMAIMVCLILAACGPGPTVSPDDYATIVAGAVQTAAVNNQSLINTAVAQTVTAKESINNAVAQTVTAMAGGVNQPATTPFVSETQPPLATLNIPVVTGTVDSTSAPLNNSNIVPAISFTFVPPIGNAEYVSGIVEGVDPNNYVVAIYIKVEGRWWTKPYYNQPTVSISSNGEWSAPYATGGRDVYATVICAYLIPAGYVPPVAGGEATLPSILEQTMVAKVEVIRQE